MADRHQDISAVVEAARRTVSLSRALIRSLWVIAIVSGLTVIGGIAFVMAGFAVPAWIYALAAGIGIPGLVIAFVLGRINARRAAALLDEHFGLEDGTASAIRFASDGHDGGFYTLQHAWLTRRLDQVDVRKLRAAPSRRLVAAATIIPLLAVGLAFAPESSRVAEERARFARTEALAHELNVGLEEQVRRDIEESQEEEKEALEPDDLVELVEKLEISGDEEELLRQYAEMEREVTERAAALDRARAENLLASAGAELAAGSETQKLGEMLERGEFEQAAREMEALRPNAKAPTAEQLEAKRAELDQLKAMSSKLGEAARRHRASGKATNGQARKADGRHADQDGDPNDFADALAGEMSDLEEAVEEMERSLQQCENGQCNAENGEKAAAAARRAGEAMSRLQRRMRTMDGQRRARSRLSSLARQLGQCQGAVAGQCSSPFAGGKQAGSGTASGENQEQTPNDGITQALTGIRNSDGPSQSIVEDADSGTGVSTRRSERGEMDYAHQLESFVSRPDVPESVRDGVKSYFETIHGTGQPVDPDETGQADGSEGEASSGEKP